MRDTKFINLYALAIILAEAARAIADAAKPRRATRHLIAP